MALQTSNLDHVMFCTHLHFWIIIKTYLAVIVKESHCSREATSDTATTIQYLKTKTWLRKTICPIVVRVWLLMPTMTSWWLVVLIGWVNDICPHVAKSRAPVNQLLDRQKYVLNLHMKKCPILNFRHCVDSYYAFGNISHSRTFNKRWAFSPGKRTARRCPLLNCRVHVRCLQCLVQRDVVNEVHAPIVWTYLNSYEIVL